MVEKDYSPKIYTPIKAPYRTIIPAPPHTYRQTHSGEILMGAASGNRAGWPPEKALSRGAKPCNPILPKLWEQKSCLSYLMKKVPVIVPQKSATKCDNSKMHEELIQDTIVQNYRQIVHFETNLGTKIHQSKLF